MSAESNLLELLLRTDAVLRRVSTALNRFGAYDLENEVDHVIDAISAHTQTRPAQED